MNPLIEKFLNHMADVKGASENTLQAYSRDLLKLENYLSTSNRTTLETVTTTALMAFVLSQHKNGKHASTVSRSIAVIKTFYKHLYYERAINHDPAYQLKPPKIPPGVQSALSKSDKDKLMCTQHTNPKTIRDHAIAALIASTNIKVSAIIDLNLHDINLSSGTIQYEETKKTTLTPDTLEFISTYIIVARNEILKDIPPQEYPAGVPLFVNMKGQRLTRQGLWKIVRDYGRRAHLESELSPRLLRARLENGVYS